MELCAYSLKFELPRQRTNNTDGIYQKKKKNIWRKWEEKKIDHGKYMY